MIVQRRPLLEVEDLAVSFAVHGGRVQALDGVSLSIKPGETFGIVGESGSGKSVMAYSLVGLLAGDNVGKRMVRVGPDPIGPDPV